MSATKIPAVGAPAPFQPPRVHRHTFANGLQLIAVHKPGLPVFDAQLCARGGGVLDPLAQVGRASLTAELLDEGTAHHSALELAGQVELLGADLDVHAAWEATFLTLHGLTPQFAALLDLFAEVALQPTLPQEEFVRKQEERLAALLQERDEPRTVASKALQRAIFGDLHPYGWPLAGTSASISALTVNDLVSYYQQAIGPRTSHIILAGDIQPDELLRALGTRFGGWQSAAAPQPSLPSAPRRARAIYLVDRPDAAQSEVRFGHVGVPRGTPDYFPLLVLNTILGGSFKSRLNTRLREEKGFTYGASTTFTFRRQGGVFSGGAAVFTDASAEAVRICTEEMQRICEDPVSTEELERARNYLAIGFARRFETTGDIVSQLRELALHDLPDEYLATFAQRVRAVSREDVLQAARAQLHPGELSIVVVGKVDRVREPLTDLQLGPVINWNAE
jgi:predicted Zn-dependent peptidase